jgi:AraC-like DNA-binding protein
VRDTRDEGIGGAVTEIVVRLLPDGPPDVASVAKVMGVSVRTLQRRLLAAGLTFVGIVARARLDVARRLLDDPARKVIDVALDLGYSDHAHFTRAFGRWTGLAPRDFRRRAHASREAVRESAASTKPEIVVETARRVA